MPLLRFSFRLALIIAVLLLCSAAVQQDKSQARLKFVIGKVEVQPTKQTSWQAAKLNQSVSSGDRIRTMLSARAELEMPDGSVIKINENTVFDVKEIKTTARDKQDRMSFTLWAGNIWAQFQKAVDTRSQREIESPSAVVAIRGTILEMDVDAQQTTRVKVIEGQVALTSKDAAGEVSVGSNQEAVVEKGKPPSAPRTIGGQPGDQTGDFDFAVGLTQFQFTDPATLSGGLPLDGRVPPGTQLTANGVPLTVSPSGQFSGRVTVQEGLNDINLTAQKDGKSKSKTLRVLVNTKRPELRLSRPITAGFINRRDYSLTGTVFDATPADKIKVFINNELVQEAQQQGTFNRTVILNEGKNDIRLSAVDISKNATELAEQIFLDTVKPIITITEPAQPVFIRFEPPRPPNGNISSFNEEKFTQQIRGLIIDPEPSSGIKRISINGKEIKPNSDGSFTTEIILIRTVGDRVTAAAPAENRLSIYAEDLAGNIVRDNSRVIILR
jgi:hypothetical protein